MDPMLINVDGIQEHDDLRVRVEAAQGLTRLVELLETARQDPDYVECVGDADLFAHLTWAAAHISHDALDLYEAQHPQPAVSQLEGLDGGGR